MKKACQISSLWLVSILYGACGTIENHHVVTGALAAPYQGQIRIAMENAPVPDDFIEIAIVQSVGTGIKAKLEYVIEGLKDEARRLGANSVMRIRVDQGSNSATAVGVAGNAPLRSRRPPPQAAGDSEGRPN